MLKCWKYTYTNTFNFKFTGKWWYVGKIHIQIHSITNSSVSVGMLAAGELWWVRELSNRHQGSRFAFEQDFFLKWSNILLFVNFFVINGHASLLNNIFGLRASPFVFLVTKFKVLDEGSIWALLSSFLSRPNFCGETVFSFYYKRIAICK